MAYPSLKLDFNKGTHDLKDKFTVTDFPACSVKIIEQFKESIEESILKKVSLNRSFAGRVYGNLFIQTGAAMRNTKLSEAGYRDALFSPLLHTSYYKFNWTCHAIKKYQFQNRLFCRRDHRV